VKELSDKIPPRASKDQLKEVLKKIFQSEKKEVVKEFSKYFLDESKKKGIDKSIAISAWNEALSELKKEKSQVRKEPEEKPVKAGEKELGPAEQIIIGELEKVKRSEGEELQSALRKIVEKMREKELTLDYNALREIYLSQCEKKGIPKETANQVLISSINMLSLILKPEKANGKTAEEAVKESKQESKPPPKEKAPEPGPASEIKIEIEKPEEVERKEETGKADLKSILMEIRKSDPRCISNWTDGSIEKFEKCFNACAAFIQFAGVGDGRFGKTIRFNLKEEKQFVQSIAKAIKEETKIQHHYSSLRTSTGISLINEADRCEASIGNNMLEIYLFPQPNSALDLERFSRVMESLPELSRR